MASENRNALAELADELAWYDDSSPIPDSIPTMQLHEAINKAHRIITELAKVQDEENALYSMENITAEEARNIIRQREGNCILKCRAIAEEGAKE